LIVRSKDLSGSWLRLAANCSDNSVTHAIGLFGTGVVGALMGVPAQALTPIKHRDIACFEKKRFG
jgi:hypothetical protein